MHKRILIIGAFAFLIAACGGGGSSSDSAERSYTVGSFVVTGTSANNAAGQAPISPTTNGGNFVLTWKLADIANQQHIVSAFVSQNNVLSDSDIKFYRETCNGATACGSSNPFSKDCFFTNANRISCAGDPGDGADITAFLDALPKDAFIIFKSCDSSSLNCSTASYPVQFQ